MILTVKITGTDDLERNLLAFAAEAQQALGRALFEEAEIEMAEAKRRTPVDTGTLRSSGAVYGPYDNGDETHVILGFGGPAAAYALAVHEHLSEFSPPSWRNLSADEIEWSVPGTGPKYLEGPLLEAAPYLGQRLARRLQAAL